MPAGGEEETRLASSLLASLFLLLLGSAGAYGQDDSFRFPGTGARMDRTGV